MIKIIDYIDKYKDDLMLLQQHQWGANSDSDEIFLDIDNYLIKLVLNDDVLVGTIIYHFIEKDVIYLDMIVIDKQNQKKGIGTLLLNDLISFAKQNNAKLIETRVVDVYGVANSKKLLENFGFIKGETINNYWGKLNPEFSCIECGKCPCECTMHEYYKIL